MAAEPQEQETVLKEIESVVIRSRHLVCGNLSELFDL